MVLRNKTSKSSKRKVSVPNLSSRSRSQAQNDLTSRGLSYSDSSQDTSDSGLSLTVASQSVSSGDVVLLGSNVSFVYYNYVPPAPPPTPYPNIGSAIAYGAGSGQAWTQNEAYITWGGSGWGSYTVVASNGSSNNSPSSAGGPPVLLSGFSAGTSYSVTVTLYANSNYSGSSASASTSFTTAAAPSGGGGGGGGGGTPPPACTPGTFCSYDVYTEPGGDFYIYYCLGSDCSCSVMCGSGQL